MSATGQKCSQLGWTGRVSGFKAMVCLLDMMLDICAVPQTVYTGASIFVLLRGRRIWAVAPPAHDIPNAFSPTVNASAHGAKLLARLKQAGLQNTTLDYKITLMEQNKSKLEWCSQPAGTAVYLPPMSLYATFNVGELVAGLALQVKITSEHVHMCMHVHTPHVQRRCAGPFNNGESGNQPSHS